MLELVKSHVHSWKGMHGLFNPMENAKHAQVFSEKLNAIRLIRT